jgi:glycosyltransferase involved in cell wall biosynthesis
MKADLFFSVIIPTYNRAGFIRRTIQSVLSQQYKNFEVIIVDDGSTDNTDEVVGNFEFSNLYYFKTANLERGAARNFGISKAKGDYITFLDSDDLLYNNYLSNAADALSSQGMPVFFHQGYEIKRLDGKVLERQNQFISDDLKQLAKGNHLSCIGVFIKRSVTGQFRFNCDRNLSGSEDWELWLRLAANFGLKADTRISAALIVHESRSVLNYDEQKLLLRKNLALKYAFYDKTVADSFARYRSIIEAYCDTYISLHLILSKKNARGMRYLLHAVRAHPACIFDRRFLAIIKYLLLNITMLR